MNVAMARVPASSLPGNFMHARIAIACFALALPLAASAQAPQNDTRTGGRPDPERMRKMFEERFKKADRDGDGALSRVEAKDGMPMLERDFDRIDANSDGKITLEELRTAMEKRRERMREHGMHGGPGGPDSKGPPDGKASPGSPDGNAPRGGPDAKGGPGGPQGMRERPTPEQMKARADEMFKRADANGDGALSEDEAKAASPRLARDFKAIDANGDGKLTREELDRFGEARRAQFEQRRQQREGGAAPPAK